MQLKTKQKFRCLLTAILIEDTKRSKIETKIRPHKSSGVSSPRLFIIKNTAKKKHKKTQPKTKQSFRCLLTAIEIEDTIISKIETKIRPHQSSGVSSPRLFIIKNTAKKKHRKTQLNTKQCFRCLLTAIPIEDTIRSKIETKIRPHQSSGVSSPRLFIIKNTAKKKHRKTQLTKYEAKFLMPINSNSNRRYQKIQNRNQNQTASIRGQFPKVIHHKEYSEKET